MKMHKIWNYLFPFDDTPCIDFNDGNFVQAQVNALFKHLPLILLADIAAGTYLFIVLCLTISGPLSVLWYSGLMSVCLLRGYVLYRYKVNPRFLGNLNSRLGFLNIGVFFSGAIWGSAWFLLPADPNYLLMGLILLWQCGVLAGAAASLTILKKSFFIFIMPPVLFTLGFLIFANTNASFVLAGAFISYIAFIVPLGMHIGRDLNTGIFLQLTNTELEANLKLQRETLKQKEFEINNQKARELDLLTEKKYADKRLQAAADERLLLLDAIEEGIFGINSIGKITFINSSACRLLQLDEEEVLGINASRLIRRRGGDIDLFTKCFIAITKCYQEGESTSGMQGDFVGKDNVVLPVRFSCWPILKEQKIVGAVVSFSDISKQKEMESLLIQSQKMDAIGRITGGVSHDFNNLLTVIMCNLQFIQSRVKEDEDTVELVNKIMSAAKSGAELVRQLLSFSSELDLQTTSVDINDLMFNIRGFLTRVLGEDITLTLNPAKKSCVGLTDKTQLQNAIFNLCVNARDAMPNGGNLSISVDRVSPTWVSPNDPREYIEIKIEDTGSGISPDVQKRIFEPFFTTKGKNKGTGLGLSMVYGFLKQTGDNVTVDSTPNAGTTFRLYIPKSVEKSPAKPVLKLVNTTPVKYHGTVLVVEDDDDVRSVAVHMLVEAGFEVVTAKNGKAGLEQFMKHPEIDLVFSDIVMPGGMNGIDMAEKILRKKPGALIVLVTGYADKMLKISMSRMKNVVCIPKPYDTNEIPKIVYSLIDGAAS